MSRAKHVSDLLGLTKSTVVLLFMVVLVGMGERMAERFLPNYMLALGGGIISIGLLNGLDNFMIAKVLPTKKPFMADQPDNKFCGCIFIRAHGNDWICPLWRGSYTDSTLTISGIFFLT